MKKFLLLSVLMSLFLISIVNTSASATPSEREVEVSNQEVNKESSYRLQLLKSDTLGRYLADKDGMTLYYFTVDEPKVSNCKDKCLEIWPAFYAKNIKAPAGFKSSDFGTITREDGQKQTTYKGHPLYYYVHDKKKGDTNGQGVNGVWFVLNKDTFKK